MRTSDNLKGAALMAGSMAAFALNDTFMKLITVDMPLSQAVVLRGVGATILIAFLALRFGGLQLRFSRRDWGLVALRTGTEVGMTYSFLKALSLMPLANLHALMQALPLTVALTAAVVLKEPLGWRRLSAILVGFVGVLLIVRPGPEGFDAAAFYGLASVGFVTMRDILSRMLSREISSLAVTFVTTVVVTLVFAVTGLAVTWTPVGVAEIGLLAGAAVAIFFGYLLSVMTMRVGEIGFIAPFRYTGLIWALILGFVVFGDWPKPITFVGAAIVVATGVFTLYRERRLLRSRATKAG